MVFQKKDICVFGKKGEGKTYHLKNTIIKPSPYPCLIIDTFNEYSDVASDLHKFGFYSRLKMDKFKGRIVPKNEDEFRQICYTAALLKMDCPLNLIFSEIDWWTSSHYLPREFVELLISSRHEQINLICDVRNPSELNRKISALTDYFVIFKSTEPLYLKYFGLFNPELIEKIKALPYRENDPLYKPIVYKV